MEKVEVKILVKTEEPKIIDTLFKALKPDNVNIPEEISLEFYTEDSTLIFAVSTERDIETLISTLREGLDYIGLCLQVLMVERDEEDSNRN
jgi:tRNA threonylcarbamoyladenosine modification (KEOPS) complex  Pcc1 subunit